MNLGHLLKTKKFLDEMAISVKNIIYSAFPSTTPEEREDIEQTVKLKIWRKISRGKKIENLRSFLWKIVYTTTLDILDERMQTIPPEEIQERADSLIRFQDRPESPELLVESKETKAALIESVKALPARRRTVVQLWLSEMTLEEISAYLGWSGNQVRHLLYRGIQDLKDKVNSCNQRPNAIRSNPSKRSANE